MNQANNGTGIVVTPEVIEAGTAELRLFDFGDTYEEYVIGVYEARERRRRLTARSPSIRNHEPSAP